MSRPRAIVVRAPGINCDAETAHAWRLAGADCEIVRLGALLDQPAQLDRHDILTLPGGFSFGDDVSAGRIFANLLTHELADRLRAFVERDRLVLGICNGFQILVKAGLLTANDEGSRCTFAMNAGRRFICRWVSVEAPSGRCLFLEARRRYFLPIAHAEGRFVVGDPSSFDCTRVALRYTRGMARTPEVNPNGSFEDVAALADSTGRVLGMMPHPERFVERTQHPFWTSLGAPPEPDGLAIFRAAVECCR